MAKAKTQTEINIVALKTTNLEKAKAILAAKGLNFTNVGISKTHITIGNLTIDYTDGLKASVKEAVDSIGISERAAITLFIEKEIAKLSHANLVSAATEATKAKAEQTLHTAKLIADAKAKAKADTPKVEAPKVETTKAKVVKLDENLKTKINDCVKDVLATKGLIYPQIVITNTSIKFGEFHEITGLLAVAEAQTLVKNLIEKTGITSERTCLVYLFEKEITYVPNIRTTDKTFSMYFGENSLTLLIDENGRFNFHPKLESTKLTKTILSLQIELGKIAKLQNVKQKLKELAEYLNDVKVKTFHESIPHVQNFLGN